jgi:hypothetical protein
MSRVGIEEFARQALARAPWSGADRQWLIESLRPLCGFPQQQIEIGDSPAAHATVFPLARGAVLPLHDHPSMTVICKVLHGRMRIESFEWVDRDQGLARELGARDVDESSEPIVFGPDPGTLHRITALTDCAFIDLFAPYYNEARPCRYYRVTTAGALRKLESV